MFGQGKKLEEKVKYLEERLEEAESSLNSVYQIVAKYSVGEIIEYHYVDNYTLTNTDVTRTSVIRDIGVHCGRIFYKMENGEDFVLENYVIRVCKCESPKKISKKT